MKIFIKSIINGIAIAIAMTTYCHASQAGAEEKATDYNLTVVDHPETTLHCNGTTKDGNLFGKAWRNDGSESSGFIYDMDSGLKVFETSQMESVTIADGSGLYAGTTKKRGYHYDRPSEIAIYDNTNETLTLIEDLYPFLTSFWATEPVEMHSNGLLLFKGINREPDDLGYDYEEKYFLFNTQSMAIDENFPSANAIFKPDGTLQMANGTYDPIEQSFYQEDGNPDRAWWEDAYRISITQREVLYLLPWHKPYDVDVHIDDPELNTLIRENSFGEKIGLNDEGEEEIGYFIDTDNTYKTPIDGYPFDINDHGQVVGSSRSDACSTPYAFIWDEQRGMIDLNQYSKDRHLDLTAAYMINNDGVIVGEASWRAEGDKLFVLIPKK